MRRQESPPSDQAAKNCRVTSDAEAADIRGEKYGG